MNYKGFTLDSFQVSAIKSIEKNNSVVVSAPTGSGKTLVADYIIDKAIKAKKRVIYTAPIKALSNQKFLDFSKEYGEHKIGLLTGDTVINSFADILIMTTEIYRNMVMVQDKIVKDVSYVIFDEIHYINDIERGVVWEESIIHSPNNVRFLCLSATIPNAEEFASWIMEIQEHQVDTVLYDHRPVPLLHQFFDNELGVTTLDNIKDAIDMDFTSGKFRRKNRTKIAPPDHKYLIEELKEKEFMPCLFFVFSRLETQKMAEELSTIHDFLSNEEKQEVAHIVTKEFSNTLSEVNKLKTVQLLRKIVSKGIAFHHAGLLPVLKHLVEALFAKGLIKVLYTTETFAVGINMPARSVCFNSLRKFDGVGFRYLNSKEYFQIAGRAGRRGIDKQGYVFSMIHRPTAEIKKIKSFTTKDVEPIISQFKQTYNTVLNLLKRYDTKQQIITILSKSFASYQTVFKRQRGKLPNDREIKQRRRLNDEKIRRRFENIMKILKNRQLLQGDELTTKGEFASLIFVDELIFTEIFCTDFHHQLNVYQILLVLGCLVYEHKFRNKFYNTAIENDYRTLKKLLKKHKFLKRIVRFDHMKELTAVIRPLHSGKPFLDIMKNTNITEGDIIKLFRQILDRIGQIQRATSDYELKAKLDQCSHLIDTSLEGVYMI